MIRAHLVVRFQFDKDEDGNPRTEHWGEFDFNQLPAAGDYISVDHDNSDQTVVVKYIEHFAIRHPLSETSLPSLQRTQPTQHVIADWAWAD